MTIDRIQPLPQPQQITNINLAGDQSKVLSKETGLPVVARQDETAQSDNNSADRELSRREIQKLSERLNRIMGLIDKRLHFSVHEKSGKIQVKVIDQETNKVIDEIPPTKLLDLLSSFRDMTGIIFDHKA